MILIQVRPAPLKKVFKIGFMPCASVVLTFHGQWLFGIVLAISSAGILIKLTSSDLTFSERNRWLIFMAVGFCLAGGNHFFTEFRSFFVFITFGFGFMLFLPEAIRADAKLNSKDCRGR
jgi:hypothetical protein